MEITLPQPATPPTRVWDIYVPIVTSKNITHVYLTEAIDEPSYYNELCFLLDTASSDDHIHIHLNTPGGMIDSTFMLISSIKNTKAKVTAHLSGTVASAGTMIALACQQLEVANHTAFMVHNYSAGMIGKGHEMKARQEFTDASIESAFKDIYGDFLTAKEIREVIDGKDMWMPKDEVIARFNGTYFKSPTAKLVNTDQPTPVKVRRGRPKKDS